MKIIQFFPIIFEFFELFFHLVYFAKKYNILVAYKVGRTADILFGSLYKPLNHVSNSFRNEYLKKIRKENSNE